MAAKNSVFVASKNNAAKDDVFSGATIDWLAEGGSLKGTLPVLGNDPGSAHLFGVYAEKPEGDGPLPDSTDATFTVTYEGMDYAGHLTANEDGTVGFDLSALSGAFDLAEGETFDVTFCYAAQIGKSGVLSTAEVTVQLTGVGDGPADSGGEPPAEQPPVLIPNGAFESGFTGWSAEGSTTTTDSAPLGDKDITADDNSFFAALATDDMLFGGTIQTDSQIETFLGLGAGDLDSLASNDAVEGSAIKTTVHLNAGDTLSFDYRFGTEDSFVNDFAFFSVKSDDAGVLPSATVLSDIATVGDGGDSGWLPYSYVAPADGDYDIGVGVVDDLDGSGWSFLYVDNFAIA